MTTIRKRYEHSIDLDDTPQPDAQLDVVYVRTLSQMYTPNKCVHCGRAIVEGRTCKQGHTHCEYHLLTLAEQREYNSKQPKRKRW